MAADEGFVVNERNLRKKNYENNRLTTQSSRQIR